MNETNEERPKDLPLNIPNTFGCRHELVHHDPTAHQVVGKGRIKFR